MKSIKKIVDFIGKILPSVGQVSFRYRNTNPKHQKEEARECPFQIDLIKGMAYELLCSSRAHNIQLTPKDDEKFLIDKILASYNDALKELKRNDQLNFYIEGGGWQRQTELFKANISKGDVYSNFLQIGTRVYKNFEAIKNTQFDVTALMYEVSRSCIEFDTISSWPLAEKITLVGFDKYKYRHFHYKNFIINPPGSMHSYEMTYFIYKNKLLDSSSVVAEIGAGDGKVAINLIQNFNCKYIIFDLPEILTRSSFLISTHSNKKIATLVELKEYSYNLEDCLSDHDIILLPCWYVSKLPDKSIIDLWINTHSLGEMPIEIAREYCRIIDKTGKQALLINRDRDIDSLFYFNGIHSYISEFNKLKLTSYSYPISSNQMTLNPTYIRLYYEI